MTCDKMTSAMLSWVTYDYNAGQSIQVEIRSGFLYIYYRSTVRLQSGQGHNPEMEFDLPTEEIAV